MRRVFPHDEATFRAALEGFRLDNEIRRHNEQLERELRLSKERSDRLLDARRQERAHEPIEFAI